MGFSKSFFVRKNFTHSRRDCPSGEHQFYFMKKS
jgi:hypothetical protein